MHVLELKVRPNEVDTFSHVNNAAYLSWLEWARAEWAESLGYPYGRFLEEGVVPAVVEVRLKYRGQARMGEILKIHSRARLLHSARAMTLHNIYNAQGRCILKGEIELVAVDLKTGSFTEYPPAFLQAMHLDREETP